LPAPIFVAPISRAAKFDRADLSGADLRDVQGLTREQLDNAICDSRTRLPDELNTVSDDGA
jgi:uncharacterized protein YjbI with pentapeptide repeats